MLVFLYISVLAQNDTDNVFFFHNFTPVALRGQFTEYTDFADYSLLMSNQEMGTDK